MDEFGYTEVEGTPEPSGHSYMDSGSAKPLKKALFRQLRERIGKRVVKSRLKTRAKRKYS